MASLHNLFMKKIMWSDKVSFCRKLFIENRLIYKLFKCKKKNKKEKTKFGIIELKSIDSENILEIDEFTYDLTTLNSDRFGYPQLM